MAKAYFNRHTGKFEMQFRDGRHFVWNGYKWLGNDGSSLNGRSFTSWYNRKGRYVENNWNRRNIRRPRESNASSVPAAQTNMTENRRKGLIAVGIIITLFVFLLILFVAMQSGGNSANGTTSLPQVMGTQSDPFQPNPNETITWQGSGYYNMTNQTANDGNPPGIYYISNNQFILNYNIRMNSMVTTTTSTTTVITTKSSSVATTISQTMQNNVWATQFFENVSGQRGSTYTYCPGLSQFAQIRFNTQISNYDISHYGVEQDDAQYGIYDAEEVLFQSGSPMGYASQLKTDDPAHWQLLMDNSYTYYGDYIGSGPSVESYCNPGPEIPGPNINISQYLESQGCTPVIETASYFIVELDNICPSNITT